MSLTATQPPGVSPTQGAALDSLLDAVDVQIREQRRIMFDADTTVALDPSALSLAYVVSGEVQVRSGGQSIRRIAAGAVMLASGRVATALSAQSAASILLSELDLADPAAHIAALLPGIATITDFAAHEPAAAALAQHLGAKPEGDNPNRSGDLAICRMMATTVLASVIRAWAANGCAPEGWPATASDPFLDRVVEAVRADPGRNWTVDTLASLGAMSRSVFAERFRAAFGRSPAGYVAAVRMHTAQELLSRGHGVSAVSRELGYASDEGFSRAFRRHVGTTPSAWRAEHRLTPA
ncbi:AraC family transcriptional regulator [Microbacterium sp. Mu-80]|uniref:AraC family transcriptional regulator n=1 Tax=Microbacterium bandirmense TaxID=3122050 RepID=A0ABU8LEY7_9MICO